MENRKAELERAAAPGGRSVNRQAIWPALYMLGYFVAIGTALFLLEGQPGQLVFFGLIGLATGGGFLIHALARPSRKHLGRRMSLAVVGTSLLLGAGIFGRQSFQLEGFFFYVLGGLLGGVVVHYLVAKIVGPIFIGRAWCGWGCWIWMVFDYLPWKRSPGRRARLGWLRPVHFAASFGLVAFLVWGVGYDHGFEWKHTDGPWWFLGGCGAYYAAGIALAATLKDNRAFCKYLCPITVFLRAGNRVSLIGVVGTPEGCTDCRACERACPMDIPVSALARTGTFARDPECTLCQSCIGVCPHGNLRLGFRLGLRRR